jgi:energy-coupling factor transport system ATP-binding protein
VAENPIIDVQDVWFRYESQAWALNGVNLRIYPGEFVAIVGQNGAGKTTLVKHFNKILAAEKGHVIVNGRDVGDIPFEEIAGQVGYCYQNPDHQIFNLTVRAELEFGLRHRGDPEEEIKARVAQVLQTVGLEGLEEEYPFALGRGQRQKLAVGTILAMNPPVMIIDEPTTGMDWQGSLLMMNLIKALHESGRTVIMITHDMRIVAEFASRAVVMAQGRVIADGTPKAIFVRSDVLSQAFLEPPQIMRIGQALSKYGMPSDVLSVGEAVAAFKQLMGKDF